MNAHIIDQVQSFKRFADARRSELVDVQEIGAEKAKTIAPPRATRVKIPTPRDLIKQKAKALGIKRTLVTKFLKDNAAGKDIKNKWEEFVEDWKHEQQMTTRKGGAERKKQLDELKKWGLSKGMRTRGKYAWNAFIVGREKLKIKDLKEELKGWLANIDAI